MPALQYTAHRGPNGREWEGRGGIAHDVSVVTFVCKARRLKSIPTILLNPRIPRALLPCTPLETEAGGGRRSETQSMTRSRQTGARDRVKFGGRPAY